MYPEFVDGKKARATAILANKICIKYLIPYIGKNEGKHCDLMRNEMEMWENGS